MNMLQRRLAVELKSAMDHVDQTSILKVVPDERDFRKWTAVITGPTGTPYESGVFTVKLIFPEDYPSTAPKVEFQTKIIHPNIYHDGSVCLDILKLRGWNSKFSVPIVLGALRQLLQEPNPDSPANYSAARLYRKSLAKFNDQVMRLVQANSAGDAAGEEIILSELRLADPDGDLREMGPLSEPSSRRQISPAHKLANDFYRLTSNGQLLDGFNGFRLDLSNMAITGTLVGPEKTNYENQHFEFVVNFSDDYPRQQPTVNFKTSKISHPNISSVDGRLSQPLLAGWRSDDEDVGHGRLVELLALLRSLFHEYNSDNVVNLEALLSPFSVMKLLAEAEKLRTSAPVGISAAPINDDDLSRWTAAIVGPIDSAYEFEVFSLTLQMPKLYPFEMPQVRFDSPISHPDIDAGCIIPLANLWRSCMEVGELLSAIQQLLVEPHGINHAEQQAVIKGELRMETTVN